MSGASKSSKSTDWANDDWGLNDPGLGMEGVHMTVFSGWPVWPSVLLVMASDHRAYLEQCMGQVNFVALLLAPQLVGAQFLDDVREGQLSTGLITTSCRTRPIACWLHWVLACAGEAHDQPC